MKRPTKEQIEAALSLADRCGQGSDILAAAYRATRQPAQIMGRTIGYIIGAALLVLSCGGLVWAVKMAVRMVAG